MMVRTLTRFGCSRVWQDEKEELRKNQKLLRKQHLQLLKNKKAKETRLKELEARARDVQMLKFGQVRHLALCTHLGVVCNVYWRPEREFWHVHAYADVEAGMYMIVFT
jgi:hypothetical protein